MADFLTQNMTAAEILNLSTEELNKMNLRDLSHALTQVSKVANQRINKLAKRSTKIGGKTSKYVGRGSKSDVSTMALNWATSDGKKAPKFGVKVAKAGIKVKKGETATKAQQRNAIYGEFSRVRDFLNMKTSTIKGAKEVRQNTDKLLFGNTREDISNRLIKEHKKTLPPSKAKKFKGVKIQKEVNEYYNDLEKDVFSNYRKFLEMKPVFRDWADSKKAIRAVASATINGENIVEAAERIASEFDELIYQQNLDFEQMKGGLEF